MAAAVTINAPDDELALATPPEPLEIQSELRRTLLGGADWVATFGAGLGVGDTLWASWGATLEPAGLDRAGFEAVVQGCRRELWFWILGDRRWDQVMSGLAGRVRRRLPER